jgi:ketosteroid isomerase-like protein
VNGQVGAVKRYLSALRARDWDALRETLHDDVVRFAPYRDVVRGGDEYRDFLADVISGLAGYELNVTRVLATAEGAVVELSETVDQDGERMRTDESVVFDVDASGLIRRIAVYLQTSHVLRRVDAFPEREATGLVC